MMNSISMPALCIIMTIGIMTTGTMTMPAYAADTWKIMQDPYELADTSMTYEICDRDGVKKIESLQYGNSCYEITLEFHTVLKDDIGSYIIAHATSEIIGNESSKVQENILLINIDTLQIKNINGSTDLAESLQRTLFWLGHNKIDLIEGKEIETMSASLPENISITVIATEKSKVFDRIYTIGYSLNQESKIQIVPELALPIHAEVYSIVTPHTGEELEFRFDLIAKNGMELQHNTFNDSKYIREETHGNNNYQKEIPENLTENTETNVEKHAEIKNDSNTPSIKNTHYPL